MLLVAKDYLFYALKADGAIWSVPVRNRSLLANRLAPDYPGPVKFIRTLTLILSVVRTFGADRCV